MTIKKKIALTILAFFMPIATHQMATFIVPQFGWLNIVPVVIVLFCSFMIYYQLWLNKEYENTKKSEVK